jgi:ribosomal protein S17E
MGRIKSMAIKRTSNTLLKKRDDFSESFHSNKEILKNYDLPDKGTRNKIAGYIARIKKAESKKRVNQEI